MIEGISKKSNHRLRFLGWYQIIGGAAGLLITIWIIAKLQAVSGLVVLLCLFALGLYGFSIFCGKLILGPKYQMGLRFSVINQLLQIISLFTMGYGFLYIAGAYLMVVIGYSSATGFNVGLNFGLTSTWKIDFATDDYPFKLSFNFVACYLTYYCYNLRRLIKEEQNSPGEFTAEDYTIDTIN